MLRLIALLMLTVLTLTAAPAGALTCIDPFSAPAENPLRLPADGVLSPHELKEVKAIFSSDKPANERWTDVAHLYLNARLRLLPIEYRDAIRKELTRFRPSFANVSDFDGSTKEMVFPREYAETPLPYVIMVHEWEHLIRSYVKSGGRDWHTGSISAKFNPAAMYVEEAGAIRAEWELARFISDSEAAHLVEIPKALNNNRKTRTVVETIAVNAHLSREDYLAATRASGRYSVGNTIQKVAKTTGLVALGLGYLGGMGAAGCWVVSLFTN